MAYVQPSFNQSYPGGDPQKQKKESQASSDPLLFNTAMTMGELIRPDFTYIIIQGKSVSSTGSSTVPGAFNQGTSEAPASVNEVSTYFCKAPMTGVRISQSADYNMLKTLAGNFNLITFEDNPVIIVLQGLENISAPKKSDSTAQGVFGQGQQQSQSKAQPGGISQLYSKYKISNRNTEILDIVIGEATYKAVIVGFIQESFENYPRVVKYQLTLYGVRSDKNGE